MVKKKDASRQIKNMNNLICKFVELKEDLLLNAKLIGLLDFFGSQIHCVSVFQCFRKRKFSDITRCLGSC